MDWTEIDRLVKEYKLQEARQRLDEMLPAIRESGDEEEWTRALVRGAQLRAGSAEPAEAVRFLQSQPWPQGKRQHAVLSLFLAEALKNYYDNYRWTIWENEAVLSDKPVDVERWTTGQLFEAVSKAYLEAWKERELLGGIAVTEIPNYLKPNTYPKEVRGTLRDTVAYLWVQHLADTGYWSPAQENAAERLDLTALLREGELPDEQLADPEVHPLRRSMALLADHERWHLSRSNRDGALEARLERYRQLRRHALPDELKALRQELEKDLPGFRQVPWWAMGMVELANLYQSANDLPAALSAARAAQKAYPKSPGGESAAAMVHDIEAPAYHLQAMLSDGLRRRSLQVNHKNLPALWFRAYRFDLRQRLARKDNVLFPFVRDLLATKPDYAWKTDLPATPDYQMHTTWVTPAIDRNGAYVVLASAREDFAYLTPTTRKYLENRVAAAPLILGDLVLVAREHESGRVEVAALSGETGEPLPGVQVTRFEFRGGRWGEPVLDRESLFDVDEGGSSAFFASRGDDVALLLHPYRYRPEPERTGRGSLVFTDRSIYRPQQKLFWKVLVYDNQGRGRLQAIPQTSVTVELVDPNNQAVESRTVSTNDFGTASGEMTIPPGRPLGPWTVRASYEGAATVRVEEYKRPTFEVTLEDPKEPLRLNRTAAFPGQARYYFGLPVTHGELRWRALREERWSWWWWPQPGREETVATGTAELSADGTFEIVFTPEAGNLHGRDPRELSYFYRIEADLTDEGGETRSARRSFRLGHVSIEAEITPDRDLYVAGGPGKVTIQRRDLAGIGRSGEGTWTLFALDQPAETPLPSDVPLEPGERIEGSFLTEGDRLRPRWEPGYDPERILRGWEDGARIASGTLAHGPDGRAELALPALEPGAYRLRYETADEAGETFATWRELIVAGEDTPLALPAILRVDDSEARPGGKVKVLVHSGFPGQVLWLEVWKRYKLIARRELRMGRDADLSEIPIRPEDRGGFSLRLVALRDHQLLQLDRHVNVPWDDRRLDVEVGTFRDRIRPGTRETWTVKVRPAEGQEPAAAELLAYLYDRSLDLFAPHNPASPLGLYPITTGAGWSGSSLGTSPTYGEGYGWPQRGYGYGRDLQPDELLFALAFELEEAMVGGVVGGVMSPVEVPAPPPPAPPAPPASKMATAQDLDVAETRASAKPMLEAAPEPAPELRSDFSETAFWQPHLIAGPDGDSGTVAIEFEVPDSVTSWSFWVHAVTADLRAGSLQKEVRSVKDLMVRPYVPRFLRESDRALLEVVVNNASESELSGTVQLDIVDPGSEKSLLADFGIDPAQARAPFTVAAGGGASVTFPLTAPKKVGPVAFKVTAVAGSVSDGELRPLPVLPSRMHLAQSRFAALKDPGRRELRFEDMSKPDPTRIDEQLVVTLDAQLFYSVLEALPYLVDYPYECTEQTLNRFLSTGIAASLFDEYPAVASMAEQLSKRETRLETWDAVDPNRKMALEETPWLQTAQGGEDPGFPLIKVLDPKVARAQRDQALAKLREAQLDNGGFPWWPGGQASPYMTLYLLYGFGKAQEAGIEVPEDMVERAWEYVLSWYREQQEELRRRGETDDCCRELRVFLNYVASSHSNAFPAEERRKILDDSFAHWKELSGYLKALLALTLNRMKRPDDAKLVFDAVMDLAKTTENEGTFFAPEKEAWLWYQDNVETHAFALLAMMEISPDDPRRHGLVQWLFVNKQLNHWHSTKATAEVIYALVHYLEKEGQLGVRETATIRVADQATTFTFEPDRFTGKHNQVVVPGEKLGPQTTVVVEKESAPLMFASATWHFSTDQLPTEARGDLFGVTRRYFLRSGQGKEVTLSPLAEGAVLKPGDEVEVQLTINSRAPAEYVHLRDPRAAGLEPDGARSGYVWDWTSPGRYEETRDSGTNFFFDWLPAGEYVLKYRVRANMAGTFRVGPATLQSMYAPEFTAYSAGDMMTVAPAPK